MDTLKNMSIKILTDNCREQTQRYYRQEKHDTKYCYELFRRFFEDNCDKALNALYTVYKPHVWHWVKSHRYFYKINATEDEIIIDSMSHFVFALRRHPFSHFSTIGALLSYWRMCVNSIIMNQWHRNERRKALENAGWDSKEVLSFDNNVLKTTIWERVQKILQNSDDQMLARLIYLYDMKPRQIVKEHPEIWNDPDTVRVAQQRIKRHLKKDNTLFELLMELDL